MSGANCSDRICQRWTENQVDITLGAPPSAQTLPQHTGIPPTLDPTALIGAMVVQFGAQMASAMKQSPGAVGTTSHHSQQRYEDLGKKVMDKDLLISLMGFSGVDDPTKVTTIWKNVPTNNNILNTSPESHQGSGGLG